MNTMQLLEKALKQQPAPYWTDQAGQFVGAFSSHLFVLFPWPSLAFFFAFF